MLQFAVVCVATSRAALCVTGWPRQDSADGPVCALPRDLFFAQLTVVLPTTKALSLQPESPEPGDASSMLKARWGRASPLGTAVQSLLLSCCSLFSNRAHLSLVSRLCFWISDFLSLPELNPSTIQLAS